MKFLIMQFNCPHCGGFSSLEIDFIDSGTMVECSECNKEVVFDVWRPEDRKKFYEKAL